MQGQEAQPPHFFEVLDVFDGVRLHCNGRDAYQLWVQRIKEEHPQRREATSFERWTPSKYRTAPHRCPLARDFLWSWWYMINLHPRVHQSPIPSSDIRIHQSQVKFIGSKYLPVLLCIRISETTTALPPGNTLVQPPLVAWSLDFRSSLVKDLTGRESFIVQAPILDSRLQQQRKSSQPRNTKQPSTVSAWPLYFGLETKHFFVFRILEYSSRFKLYVQSTFSLCSFSRLFLTRFLLWTQSPIVLSIILICAKNNAFLILFWLFTNSICHFNISTIHRLPSVIQLNFFKQTSSFVTTTAILLLDKNFIERYTY